MDQIIKITRLTMEDYEIINKGYHALHKKHVEGRPDIFKDIEELFTIEEYREMVEHEEYIAVGARMGAETAGFLIAKHKITPENPMLHRNHTLYVDAIYVEEAYRRMGIGRMLYRYLEAAAKKEQCRRIDLKVWGFNQGAAAFYESLGLWIQTYNMEKIIH